MTIRRGGSVQETEGPYGDEGYIYQALARIPIFDGRYPVLGSWVIDVPPRASVFVNQRRRLRTISAPSFPICSHKATAGQP